MNLEEESSKLRSEEPGEEKGSEKPGKMTTLGETKAEFNGELGHEEPPGIGSPVRTGGGDRVRDERGSVSPAEAVISPPGDVKVNGDPVGREFSAESLSNPLGSPSGKAAQGMASKPAPSKGYGLKKWRRIPRDLSKDITGVADSAQILKRRLSLAETSKARDDNRHKSNVDGDGEDDGEGEGSVASLVSMNVGGTPFVVAPATLDPDLGLLVAASGFNIGMDSENSDDHSSKSSTAASAPRMRYEAIGFGRDRSRARTTGGKVSGHVVQQKGQRTKAGRIDTSRKFREHQVKIEIENSYSSVESDLRSTNAAFVRMDSVASNRKQSEKSMNFDGEQSDDAQPSEEVRSSFYKENGTVGDFSREDLDADLSGEENNTKSENSRKGSDADPFLESIISLQVTKEALENEIQKFGEIGNDKIFDDSDSQHEETEGISSPSVESNFVELNQKIVHLECRLGEAIANIRAKESKVIELEDILKRKESLNKKVDSTNLSLLQERCKEMEIELENLLEKKIGAEIEYLIMTRTTQSWRVLAENHIALIEDQKSLSGKIILGVKNAENNAFMFKGRAEELEQDLLAAKEVLRLQSRVFKHSLCCFVQMVLLCIAFGLFIMHLLPSSGGVAPT